MSFSESSQCLTITQTTKRMWKLQTKQPTRKFWGLIEAIWSHYQEYWKFVKWWVQDTTYYADCGTRIIRYDYLRIKSHSFIILVSGMQHSRFYFNKGIHGLHLSHILQHIILGGEHNNIIPVPNVFVPLCWEIWPLAMA